MCGFVRAVANLQVIMLHRASRIPAASDPGNHAFRQLLFQWFHGKISTDESAFFIPSGRGG
jgi:hypothetical protein